MISDAAAILGQLTKLGCRVSARGDKLRVEASGVVPPDLLQAAREHKADLLSLLAGAPPGPSGPVHALMLMRLDTFAHHGQPIEVRVPWWAQTLWFVPDEPHARRLEAEGVSRGRIWTAGELTDLLTIRDQPAARMAAIAKLEFGGEAVQVRPRG